MKTIAQLMCAAALIRFGPPARLRSWFRRTRLPFRPLRENTTCRAMSATPRCRNSNHMEMSSLQTDIK